ncbi:MAG: murein biosynthesis integral membrane protein MurJ [Clostridiales bacterium]|nr:murein biosynthesis integral membrane protein MurJ [Clostridiales bacterium]
MTNRNKPTLTIMAMTIAALLSKVLGLIRQMLIASSLGGSVYATAFSVASKLPLAIYDMFFAAAIVSCFIPFYNRKKNDSLEKASQFSSVFLSFVVVLTLAVSIVGALCSKWIIAIYAPNISSEAAELASKMLSIMFPSMIFAAGTFTLAGILQSHDSFILPSAVSCISNAALIIYLATQSTIDTESQVIFLSVVYTASWIIQFITVTIPLIKKKFMPKPTIKMDLSLLSELKTMVWLVMLSSWMAPASSVLATFFSSFVSDMTVAAFDYSLSVFTIASGLLTFGILNYTFPKMSSSADVDPEEFKKTSTKALQWSFLLSLPVAIILFFCSKQIIEVLYMRGNFGEDLAHECTFALRILALSIPAFSIREAFSKILFSKKNAKTPAISSVIGVFVFAICGVITNIFLKLGIMGVAISFCVSQYASVLIFIFVVIRYRNTLFVDKTFIQMLIISGSIVVPTVVAAFVSGPVSSIVGGNGLLTKIAYCVILTLIICIIYAITLLILRNKVACLEKGGSSDGQL